MLASETLSNKLRLHVVEMAHRGKSSHVGSALSIVDIVSVLYASFLKYDVTNPKCKSRDRFILSKGHAGAVVYAALAECGFFDIEELKNHYKNGSSFSGHISHKGIPGVELSTGSLGHGLGVGVGMALALKKQGSSARVIVLCSDGELNEGSIWESVMFSAFHKLDNLLLVVDKNELQSLTSTKQTLDMSPIDEKFRSFNFNVLKCDGHRHKDILACIKHAFGGSSSDNRPSVLLAETVKGKGVSFMENQVLWHYRSPQGEEYTEAIAELQSTDR